MKTAKHRGCARQKHDWEIIGEHGENGTMYNSAEEMFMSYSASMRMTVCAKCSKNMFRYGKKWLYQTEWKFLFTERYLDEDEVMAWAT